MPWTGALTRAVTDPKRIFTSQAAVANEIKNPDYRIAQSGGPAASARFEAVLFQNRNELMFAQR